MPQTKVLIVEDEPAIAHDIAAILTGNGYHVCGIAHSSTKALDFLMTKSPDIALLDISIKGDKDGIEIAHIIKKKYNIPFVFLTSFADRDTIERVMETAPYGYIVKPFKERDLSPAIEVALLRKTSEKKSFPTLDQLNESLPTTITSMEYQVVKLIWKGLKNQEIADELFLSINTIKTHISNLYTKTDTNSKGAIISFIRSVM
ncbi:MAG: response regulator transcription factor [Saprospiraceae bacterium]|nr:response regulator transcription factor [Saprospiraceae bacterium]